MSQRRPVPLGKKASAPADADTFVKTGDPTPATTASPGPEIAKTFRIPASLSRRLKIYAAHSGRKEKDILAAALTEHLEGADAWTAAPEAGRLQTAAPGPKPQT